MIAGMPQTAATVDAFEAVAEPRRREILRYLSARERPVNDIVAMLALPQPAVSKHLKVLREAGLVEARRDGRQILYRTNAAGLKPIHEWSGWFEQYWRHQLARIKERAERH
jgi:DNA-binding transcriptional ArsR family regulator